MRRVLDSWALKLIIWCVILPTVGLVLLGRPLYELVAGPLLLFGGLFLILLSLWQLLRGKGGHRVRVLGLLPMGVALALDNSVTRAALPISLSLLATLWLGAALLSLVILFVPPQRTPPGNLVH